MLFRSAFDEASDNGSIIRDFVTMIGSDEDDNIWISVENQGLFCYKPDEGRLLNHLHDSGLPNVTRFWLNGNTCWLALYADNLYYTKLTLKLLCSLSRTRKEMRFSRMILSTGRSADPIIVCISLR